MNERPFTMSLKGQEAVMITDCDGAFVIEPMRFLYPYQAKREAQAINPRACHHRRAA